MNPEAFRHIKKYTFAGIGAGIAGVLSGWLFVEVAQPAGLSIWTTYIIVSIAMLGGVVGYRVGTDDAPILEMEITDVIQRDPGASLFEESASADDIAETIDVADSDALMVTLNTPGGEPVPSEDIRRAVEDFDGPTVAHATDMCASGGYLIASACDHIIAREGAMVGSVGVIGSRVNASELGDELGIQYERFAAGQYKDAGHPLKDPSEDDREYIQELLDTHYDTFVSRVADGREMSEQAVRDTEARIFLGPQAVDIGLVDEVGDKTDAREYLQDQLGSEYEALPVDTVTDRQAPGFGVSAMMQKVAYAAGAGIASHLPSFSSTDAVDLNIELRSRFR